jgi:quercetin dioxygenase-like cupin family protein
VGGVSRLTTPIRRRLPHLSGSTTPQIQPEIRVHMNGEERALEAGDAIYFDSTIPHAYSARTFTPVTWK